MYNLLHKEQLHVSALALYVINYTYHVNYVINYTYLYHHMVVLDKYTHSNLVYYKHNGDDEPYDRFVKVHVRTTTQSPNDAFLRTYLRC